MEHFFLDYFIFLAKILTFVFAVIFLVSAIISIVSKSKTKAKMTIKKLNEKFDEVQDLIESEVLSKKEYKNLVKQRKKQKKAEQNQERKRLFVSRFVGDLKASSLEDLREEITAILAIAKTSDEVLILIESPGGLVNNYGLAASQLVRLRERGISLTVAIDKVAASGGYLMACVAQKIIAAPFAYIGSIGVVAQLPNFHRVLKKNDIDFEQITAGQYKRTLTIFGENTDIAREKMKEDLEAIHQQFKSFVSLYRPQVNIDEVATGEHWLAQHAKNLNLVDDIIVSDDYLLKASVTTDIYEVQCQQRKKTIVEKMGQNAAKIWNIALNKINRPELY